MIVAIAASSLRPWIDHLANIPGADAKLATSFNDRAFRVLWKSASAIEAVGKTPEKSLRVRSLALAFMMKCPSYTSLYLIQQVDLCSTLPLEEKLVMLTRNDGF